MKPTDFAKALSQYLTLYLPGQRNLSAHTLRSYRITFKLFLVFWQTVCQRAVEQLWLRHIDDTLVCGFLDWLEGERKSSIATRNQRLACLHGFYRYLQTEAPEGVLSYQRILAIPVKKGPKQIVNHLTAEAIHRILRQPVLGKPSGRRDLTLLSLLYDAGARVQELIDLKVRDVRLDPPPILTLTGKGRKTRQVPLMDNTVALLRQYMTENHLQQNSRLDWPLFSNRQKTKLTAKGVSFILSKYAAGARTKCPAIPEKVTPHVFRHTKAMHLLQAGVNLIYIRDFLGHADIATTEVYARADTELKRKALEKAYPDTVPNQLPPWTQDDDLLAWLMNL